MFFGLGVCEALNSELFGPGSVFFFLVLWIGEKMAKDSFLFWTRIHINREIGETESKPILLKRLDKLNHLR